MNDITLTESASIFLSKILEKQKDAIGIRVGVVDSGCSGLSYKLDLAHTVEPDDKVFTYATVQIVVDQNSLQYLKGTQLDSVKEGLNESLKFNNPNAESACGCGESFSISK